jgi:hypothetical protein
MQHEKREYLWISLAILGGVSLFVAIMLATFSLGIAFESNRTVPEPKPDPTVLEIGE